MRGATAKKLRKVARLGVHSYRTLKRKWKAKPKNERFSSELDKIIEYQRRSRDNRFRLPGTLG